MKPLRRNVRRHFGLTSKQVAVRTRWPWYFKFFLIFVFISSGFLLAYWIFRGGENANIHERVQQQAIEIKELEAKLVGAQRELQVELATNNNLAKELASVQDDNIKVKEELLFYKSMLGRRSR
jgi:hypothetical protein